MFEELSTQEWFFVALAAGAGFLVVRHFMDKLPGGSGGEASPRQEAPEPPRRDGADQATWFRGSAHQGDEDAGRGFARETPSAPWYQVLEVSPTVPAGDIKAAYKRKIRKYHPDKVAGLGPEFTAIAEAKAKEINQAYRQACLARGIAD